MGFAPSGSQRSLSRTVPWRHAEDRRQREHIARSLSWLHTEIFSGEALYAGRHRGTLEAALASGWETAQTILAAGPYRFPATLPCA